MSKLPKILRPAKPPSIPIERIRAAVKKVCEESLKLDCLKCEKTTLHDTDEDGKAFCVPCGEYWENKLSASEALYGFIGWLTSQDRQTILSTDNDCKYIVDLVSEFCETHNLDEPRNGWNKNLKYPKEEE